MEKINLGTMGEGEILNAILENSICVRAILEKVVINNETKTSDDKKNITNILNDNIELVSSDDPINHKILNVIIYNQALTRKVASLYITDLCYKNGKDFDDIRQKFYDEVDALFYDLYAQILNRKKE